MYNWFSVGSVCPWIQATFIEKNWKTLTSVLTLCMLVIIPQAVQSDSYLHSTNIIVGGVYKLAMI